MEHTPSASTSSSLIRLVQASDPEAWRRLCELYAPLLFGWCQQAGLQAADIADIAQNVFAAVHRGIAGFRRESEQDSFRGWLWTIARNEVHMHFRRAAGRPEVQGGTDWRQSLEQLPAVFASETLPLDPHSLRHLVRRALGVLQAEFEPSTWQAFWRTAVDGLTAPEVAQELGLSPGAVRQAKYKVLHRLRQFLADDLPDSALPGAPK